MFSYKGITSKSEDNIPLIAQPSSEESKIKTHRVTRSHFAIKTEWDVDDEDPNDEYLENSDSYNLFQINKCQAIIHIIKCSIGTGVLAIPSGMRYSGYLLGSVSLLILSVISIYSMHLLVRVIEYLRGINPKNIRDLDYEKTVKLCFESSTEGLRKYAWMHHVLLFCLGIAQIGFLSSYQIFISENTKGIIDYYIIDKKNALSLWGYQLISFFVLTPLLFFKTLDKLSYVCQLANILVLVSLLLSVVYCFLDPLPIQDLKAVKISDSTLLFFGIVIFSFESINILNPVENSLKNRKNMGSICGVINASFCLILPVYIVVGFSGYMKFGENISSSFILSIPMEHWYFMLCKPFYVISIVISYGLQGFVMYHIIWKKVEWRLESDRMKKIADNVIRISIGLATTILSISIPHFDLFVSLIGAFSGAAILLLFPSLCNSVMLYTTKEGRFWKIKIIRNALIFIFGIIGGCLGTYTSILNINRVMNNGNVEMTP